MSYYLISMAPTSYWHNYFPVVGQIWKGYTLCRTLMNLHFDGLVLKGEVLDAGAKSSASSYYQHIDTTSANVVFSDLIPRSKEILQIDFEKPFQIESGRFDSVLAMNVLEHIYNYNNFLSEVYRVLKPGGSLIGYVPFLIPFHADPNDYFRCTHQAWERIFRDNKFSEINIEIIGQGGLLCSLDLLYTYFPNTRWITIKLRPLFRVLSIFLYTLNCWLGSMGLGTARPNGSAYLAIAFRVFK